MQGGKQPLSTEQALRLLRQFSAATSPDGLAATSRACMELPDATHEHAGAWFAAAAALLRIVAASQRMQHGSKRSAAGALGTLFHPVVCATVVSARVCKLLTPHSLIQQPPAVVKAARGACGLRDVTKLGDSAVAQPRWHDEPGSCPCGRAC
jgi:hypothetical protein